MTAAQQQQEIARQAREQARELKKEADEAERERKAAARAAQAAQRQRERMVETSIRTVGRVATSSVGQSLIRGVFGTIFGGGKRR